MNVGLSDSNLLAHLSEAAAGPLNAIGHSLAYEEMAAYSWVVCQSLAQVDCELSFNK